MPTPPTSPLRRLRRVVRAWLTMFGVGFAALGLLLAVNPERFDPVIYRLALFDFFWPGWPLLVGGIGAIQIAAAAFLHFPLILIALSSGALLAGWWSVAFWIAFATDARFPPTGPIGWSFILGAYLGLAYLLDPRGIHASGGG
jgi:hypothetical protein